ncbi:hypothetical protein J6590_064423 [Homalodisca vitripennis]|nr:hypothetical protein J6590_064423 [Homalodisca vitripennis]
MAVHVTSWNLAEPVTRRTEVNVRDFSLSAARRGSPAVKVTAQLIADATSTFLFVSAYPTSSSPFILTPLLAHSILTPSFPLPQSQCVNLSAVEISQFSSSRQFLGVLLGYPRLVSQRTAYPQFSFPFA